MKKPRFDRVVDLLVEKTRDDVSDPERAFDSIFESVSNSGDFELAEFLEENKEDILYAVKVEVYGL